MEDKLAFNFFALNDFSKMENGNFAVKGLLTTFDNEDSNANGFVYQAGCYDDFCKSYFKKNNKFISLDLLHNPYDISHIAEKVTEFNSTENEVSIVAEVSKSAVLFNNICGLIEDNVLQGFSDMSFVDKYQIAANGLIYVEKCSIVSVALVTMPAVGQSALEAMNGTKFNFQKFKKENKNTLFNL